MTTTRRSGIHSAFRLCLALTILMTSAAAESVTSAPRNESIRKADMKADMLFLTSDSLNGRKNGTRDTDVAAEFIKARLDRMGLIGAGPGGAFFQPFNLTTVSLGPDNRLEVALGGGPMLLRHPGQDYFPLKFSASGEARGPVVYAGFGIRPADYGPSVKGDIVLVLDHEPGESDPLSPFDGVVRTEASSPLRKALLAQEKGAAGILFVRDIHNHPGPAYFESAAKEYWPDAEASSDWLSLTDWVDKLHIPAAQISPSLAGDLFRSAGREFLELSRAAEAANGMAPVPLAGTTAELTVSVDRHIVPTKNVVAMIEGSDPALKNECVILCAHHDHLGVENGEVMPGADDNVSGVVAVMDIAEAYALAAQDGLRPKRSILFASWDAEETGLLGAWAYTEHPLLPLEKTLAVLNMDMIGRNEEIPTSDDWRYRGLEVQTAESNVNTLTVLGLSRFPALKAPLDKANAAFGLDIKMNLDNNVSNLLRRSDHWPFMQRGVPAVWIFTGIHPTYHTPQDRPDLINWEKLERVARLVHEMSWEIANR
jgi:hypothetical protein